MVKENNVDEAMKVLNGIMAREGMLKRWWRWWWTSAKITLVSISGGAGRDTTRSPPGHVKGSIMRSALPFTMRT